MDLLIDVLVSTSKNLKKHFMSLCLGPKPQIMWLNDERFAFTFLSDRTYFLYLMGDKKANDGLK